MREHIITAVLNQDMSASWKNGAVSPRLHAHQKTRQIVEVELGDFFLNDGEHILVAFERSKDGYSNHINPAPMEKIDGANAYRIMLDALVHTTAGEWIVQFFLVTDYSHGVGTYTDSFPSDQLRFVEYSSIEDDGLQIPSDYDLRNLYNQAVKAREEAAKALYDVRVAELNLVGWDHNGGSIYEIVFGDGTTTQFTAPKGDSGVTVPMDGFFSLAVDANGDLYVYGSDLSNYDFEYDAATGNLYLVQEVDFPSDSSNEDGETAETTVTMTMLESYVTGQSAEIVQHVDSEIDRVEQTIAENIVATESRLGSNIESVEKEATEKIAKVEQHFNSDIEQSNKTAAQNLSLHNTDTISHNDLRLEVKAIRDQLTAFLDVDDTTLDQASEIVAYIKSNKTLIDSITTSKINVADIVDNLVTSVVDKPLSAVQGVILKSLIDSLTENKADKTALKDHVKFTDIMSHKNVGVASLYEASYGGIGIKDGKLCLAGSPYTPLSDAFFKNPENYGVAVTSNYLYRWIRVALAQSTETWTDDEKAAACKTIGAVGKTDIATAAGGSNPVGGNLGLTRYKAPQYGGLAIDGNGCVTLYAGTPKETRDKNVNYTAVTAPYFNDFLIEALAGDTYPLELTDDTTDENGEVVKGTKTKVLELLGAVQQIAYNSTDGALQGRVYVVDRNNKQTSKELRITSFADSIPVRNASGNFYVNDPKLDLECANKKFVVNLPDKVTLTNEQKAKWRAMLGIE